MYRRVLKQVVVNFSASWCGPCRQIAPVYSELADKYTSVLFLTVDVDELAVSFIAFNKENNPNGLMLLHTSFLDFENMFYDIRKLISSYYVCCRN